MRCCLTALLAIAALGGAATFAQARPPTVMPSPGYDARLQESRKALSGTATVTPANSPVTTHRHARKKQPH